MAYNPANAEEAAQALYIGYFGRAGEPGGVQYWINQINAAPNLATGFALAAAAFSVQQEAKNEYAFLAAPDLASPVAFITSLYNNLLERAPDQAGLDYWVGQAQAAAGNPFAIGLLVAQFISGATNSAAGNDIDTITNKVEAASFFTQALADANISGTDANGQVLPDVAAAGKSIIGAVTEDDATVTAANEASTEFAAGGGTGEGVEITIAAGQSVSLAQANPALRSTESADTVTGTLNGGSISTAGGNDTVDVTVAGAAGSIDTGAGNDIVEVNVTAAGAEIDAGAGNDSIELTYAAAFATVVDGGEGDNTLAIITGAAAHADTLEISNIQQLDLTSAAGGTSYDAANWDGIETITASDNVATITNLVGTTDFVLTGDGGLIVSYAAGDEATDITVEFDEATVGINLSDTEVETVALEVSSNSAGADLISYAEETTVTGEGEWSGSVALLSADADGVTFDASGLAAQTALSFGSFVADATITLTDENDFSTFSLAGNFTANIVTGDGEDSTTITALSNIVLDAGDLDGWATIDWQDGDIIDVSGIFTGAGGYVAFAGNTVGQSTVEDALLNVILGTTGTGDFTTFEFQGSTYVFYDGDGNATLDAADGLLQITAVGLSATELVVV